jgi:magnesium transporter
LLAALRGDDDRRLVDVVRDRLPPEAARLIAALPDPEHRLRAVRAIADAQRIEVFPYLPLEDQRTLAEGLDEQTLRGILTGLSIDDRTALFASLDGSEAQRLFDLLEPADVQRTRDMLAYPESSVGRLMSPEFLSAMADWTIAQHFRDHALDAETSDMVYIIDQQGRLIDDVPLRRFVIASHLSGIRVVAALPPGAGSNATSVSRRRRAARARGCASASWSDRCGRGPARRAEN